MWVQTNFLNAKDVSKENIQQYILKKKIKIKYAKVVLINLLHIVKET